MEDCFVLDSPALEAAVKYRSNASYPGRRPGKNSLDASPAFGGGAGMFAVTDNGDGTASISSGYIVLSFSGNITKVNESTIKIPYDQGFISLVVTYDNEYGFAPGFAFSAGRTVLDLYIPGKQMYVPIAEVQFVPFSDKQEIIQIWQGGVINFSNWYYIK